MINENGDVIAIDFSITSIVPSSFAKYAALGVDDLHRYPILEWADIPSTDGVNNISALGATVAPMVIGPSSFARCGQRIPGAGWNPKYSDGKSELTSP